MPKGLGCLGFILLGVGAILGGFTLIFIPMHSSMITLTLGISFVLFVAGAVFLAAGSREAQ